MLEACVLPAQGAASDRRDSGAAGPDAPNASAGAPRRRPRERSGADCGAVAQREPGQARERAQEGACFLALQPLAAGGIERLERAARSQDAKPAHGAAARERQLAQGGQERRRRRQRQRRGRGKRAGAAEGGHPWVSGAIGASSRGGCQLRRRALAGGRERPRRGGRRRRQGQRRRPREARAVRCVKLHQARPRRRGRADCSRQRGVREAGHPGQGQCLDQGEGAAAAAAAPAGCADGRHQGRGRHKSGLEARLCEQATARQVQARQRQRLDAAVVPRALRLSRRRCAGLPVGCSSRFRPGPAGVRVPRRPYPWLVRRRFGRRGLARGVLLRRPAQQQCAEHLVSNQLQPRRGGQHVRAQRRGQQRRGGQQLPAPAGGGGAAAGAAGRGAQGGCGGARRERQKRRHPRRPRRRPLCCSLSRDVAGPDAAGQGAVAVGAAAWAG
jgi:hypothetical protein